LSAGLSQSTSDLVAVEAPLELRIAVGSTGVPREAGVLMRTPGDDQDLVLGVLYAEGVIRTMADVVQIAWTPATAGPLEDGARADCATVALAHSARADALGARGLSATSACGLCGRLELLAAGLDESRHPDRPRLSAARLMALPDRLRANQAVFAETGGLHAAGLATLDGQLACVREDVGRHNAVDKVVGAALSAGRLPASDVVLVVSGRIAFEIVQKAASAGVPAIVAVGAPSSLAIEAARAAGLTLVGFVRDGACNVYAGAGRLDDGA
jgi:FdhD protein